MPRHDSEGARAAAWGPLPNADSEGGAEPQPSRSGPDGPRPVGNAEKALEPILSRPGLAARNPHDAQRGRGGLRARGDASVPVRKARVRHDLTWIFSCHTSYGVARGSRALRAGPRGLRLSVPVRVSIGWQAPRLLRGDGGSCALSESWRDRPVPVSYPELVKAGACQAGRVPVVGPRAECTRASRKPYDGREDACGVN